MSDNAPNVARFRDLIDVHAHYVTDDYVAAAKSAGVEHPDGMGGWPSWSLEEQTEQMQRRGIRRAILSISSPGVHFSDDAAATALAESVNDSAIKIVADEPARFGFFASLPLPDVDAAVKELNRAFEHGASGVTVESNTVGRYLGDPAFEPIWAELDRRGSVLFMHPTSPPGWELVAAGRPRPMLEFMFESTRTIVDLILAGVTKRYPNMRVIVPHAGATLPALNDRIMMFNDGLLGAEVDWLTEFRGLWFDMAGTPFPTQVPLLVDAVGRDQLLYGSDSCWTPSPTVDAQIASIDAAAASSGARSWREVTTRNAERLFRPESGDQQQ